MHPSAMSCCHALRCATQLPSTGARRAPTCRPNGGRRGVPALRLQRLPARTTCKGRHQRTWRVAGVRPPCSPFDQISRTRSWISICATPLGGRSPPAAAPPLPCCRRRCCSHWRSHQRCQAGRSAGAAGPGPPRQLPAGPASLAAPSAGPHQTSAHSRRRAGSRGAFQSRSLQHGGGEGRGRSGAGLGRAMPAALYSRNRSWKYYSPRSTT